jgi:hypothetical protein
LNINNQDRDEAQQILEAMRQLQDDPQLKAEAQAEPEKVLDRLRLSGVARHAVALALAVAVVGPTAAANSPVRFEAFW